MATLTSQPGERDVVSDLATIRVILAQHGRLSVDTNSLSETSDLYFAGLTSLATVNVMLALESQFGLEIPDSLLRRTSFQSIDAIRQVIESLGVTDTP